MNKYFHFYKQSWLELYTSDKVLPFAIELLHFLFMILSLVFCAMANSPRSEVSVNLGSGALWLSICIPCWLALEIGVPAIRVAFLRERYLIEHLNSKISAIRSTIELIGDGKDLSPKQIAGNLRNYEAADVVNAKSKLGKNVLESYKQATETLSTIRQSVIEVEQLSKQIARLKLSEQSKLQVNQLALDAESCVRQAFNAGQELAKIDLGTLQNDTEIAHAHAILLLQNLNGHMALESLNDDDWQALLESKQARIKLETQLCRTQPDR